MSLQSVTGRTCPIKREPYPSPLKQNKTAHIALGIIEVLGAIFLACLAINVGLDIHSSLSETSRIKTFAECASFTFNSHKRILVLDASLKKAYFLYDLAWKHFEAYQIISKSNGARNVACNELPEEEENIKYKKISSHVFATFFHALSGVTLLANVHSDFFSTYKKALFMLTPDLDGSLKVEKNNTCFQIFINVLLMESCLLQVFNNYHKTLTHIKCVIYGSETDHKIEEKPLLVKELLENLQVFSTKEILGKILLKSLIANDKDAICKIVDFCKNDLECIIFLQSKDNFESIILTLEKNESPHLDHLLSTIQNEFILKDLVSECVVELFLKAGLRHFTEKASSPYLKRISERINALPSHKFTSQTYKEHQQKVYEKEKENNAMLDSLRANKVQLKPQITLVTEPSTLAPKSPSIHIKRVEAGLSKEDKFILSKQNEEHARLTGKSQPKLNLKNDEVASALFVALSFETHLKNLLLEESLGKRSSPTKTAQSSAQDIQIVHATTANHPSINNTQPIKLPFAKAKISEIEKTYINQALYIFNEIFILEASLNRNEIDDSFYLDGMLEPCFRLCLILGIFVDSTKTKFKDWRHFFRHEHAISKTHIQSFLHQIKNLDQVLQGLKKGEVHNFELNLPLAVESSLTLAERALALLSKCKVRLVAEQDNMTNEDFMTCISHVNRGWFFRLGSILRDLKTERYFDEIDLMNKIISQCNLYSHEIGDEGVISYSNEVAFDMSGESLLSLEFINHFMTHDYKKIQRMLMKK